MSNGKCLKDCRAFYENPTPGNFGAPDQSLTCSYCLSNDLPISTNAAGNPPYPGCEAAKVLQNSPALNTIADYNNAKNMIYNEYCTNKNANCSDLYQEYTGTRSCAAQPRPQPIPQPRPQPRPVTQDTFVRPGPNQRTWGIL